MFRQLLTGDYWHRSNPDCYRYYFLFQIPGQKDCKGRKQESVKQWVEARKIIA